MNIQCRVLHDYMLCVFVESYFVHTPGYRLQIWHLYDENVPMYDFYVLLVYEIPASLPL